MINFKVKTASTEGSHDITLPETTTVLELKNKLGGKDYEDIPANRQRLIYSGRVLKDDQPLSAYKIKPGNTIHMVKSAAPAAAPSSSTPAVPAVPTNIAAGTANNPLASLTGARYAGQVNLPDRSMFGADGGVRLITSYLTSVCLGGPSIQNMARQRRFFFRYLKHFFFMLESDLNFMIRRYRLNQRRGRGDAVSRPIRVLVSDY